MITLELTPEQASGLLRFADKMTHADAMRVLYGHVPKATREDQAYMILWAFDLLQRALTAKGVTSFPWIETGRAA